MNRVLSQLPHGNADLTKRVLHTKGLHPGENAMYPYKRKIEMNMAYDYRE
jgi:hypothetical protein